MTVTTELLENPTVQGQPNTLGVTGLGIVGVGQKARGGTKKPKQLAGPGQQNPWGMGGRRGRARRTNQPRVRGSFRCPAASWNRGPGTSSKPGVSPLSYPASALRGQLRRARQVPGETRSLPSSLTYRPASVPPPPLTGMQAATTWAAAATRLCPALTSTLADPHQLSFQHKQKSSGRGATPIALSRPSGSDARAARVYPPGREEPLRSAPAWANLSIAAPFSRHAQ